MSDERRLSDEEIDAIVDRSLHRVFESIGIDLRDYDSRKAFRDDLDVLRTIRKGSSNVWTVLSTTTVMATIGAIGWLLMEGFKNGIRAITGGGQ